MGRIGTGTGAVPPNSADGSTKHRPHGHPQVDANQGQENEADLDHNHRKEPNPLTGSTSAIGMLSRTQNVADPIPAPDHRHEAENSADGKAQIAVPAGLSPVQGDHQHQQGDQRANFLGIPTPETPPRDVGPQAAEDRAGSQQQDGYLNDPIVQRGQDATGQRRPSNRRPACTTCVALAHLFQQDGWNRACSPSNVALIRRADAARTGTSRYRPNK